MAWLYVILAIIVIALVIVIANLKIVPQSKAYVIERLGAYLTTWQTGFHVKIRSLKNSQGCLIKRAGR